MSQAGVRILATATGSAISFLERHVRYPQWADRIREQGIEAVKLAVRSEEPDQGRELGAAADFLPDFWSTQLPEIPRHGSSEGKQPTCMSTSRQVQE
jgi:hypothetical protein